jgi:hypothetical protein
LLIDKNNMMDIRFKFLLAIFLGFSFFDVLAQSFAPLGAEWSFIAVKFSPPCKYSSIQNSYKVTHQEQKKGKTVNVIKSDVSSFYSAHTNSFNDFGIEEVEVEVITIDKFIEQGNPIPELIKIDVELYEYQALKGAIKLLSENNPLIIIELFNDEVKRKLNPALDKELEKGITLKTEKLLLDLDYYFYLISNHGLFLVENLHSNPDSSMYLLSKKELTKKYYLKDDFHTVASELLN